MKNEGMLAYTSKPQSTTIFIAMRFVTFLYYYYYYLTTHRPFVIRFTYVKYYRTWEKEKKKVWKARA